MQYDEAFVEEVARRLKPSRGPQPKPEMVTAALALARNPRLSAAKVAPKGGHTRAAQLAQRITELQLLPADSQSAADAADDPDAANAEAERKRKHAEAQGRYAAKRQVRQERAAYLRAWDELSETEQAAANHFGFENCESWECSGEPRRALPRPDGRCDRYSARQVAAALEQSCSRRPCRSTYAWLQP